MKFTVHGVKGSFEADADKVRAGADLAYEIGGLRGKETEAGESFVFVPVRVIPTAQIYRLRLDDGSFVDALEVFPGRMMPVGRGKEIDEKGEPVYEESYAGKTFDQIIIGGGISRKDAAEELAEILADEELKADFLEALADAGITEEDLQKASEGNFDAVDKVMNAVAENFKPKDVKDFFGRKFAKNLIKDDKVVYNPARTLNEKEFKEKGEKLQLNAVMVGVDDEGNVRVVYAPDRLKINSATALAKAVNSARPEYSAVLFVSGIRENQLTEKGTEYILNRLEKYRQALEKNGTDEEALELVETTIAAVQAGDKKALPILLDKAHEKRKEYLMEQEILKDQLLVKSRNGGYFLKTNMGGIGYPLMDYTKMSSYFAAEVPRPIKVEGEWRVQPSVKLLGAVDKEGNVREIKSDAYTMAFDYPIYKVLSKLASGEMKKGEPLTFSQVRALVGDGFDEKFLGLNALEKRFGKFKGAGAVYTELIRYIRDKIGEVVFKSDEEIKKMGEDKAVEKVKEIINSDPFLSEYVKKMDEYLRMRSLFKPVELNVPKEKRKELFSELRKAGAVLKGKESGLFYVSRKPEYRKKGVEILKKELGIKDDREALKTLYGIVKNANFYVLTKETQKNLFDEKGAYAEQLKEAKRLGYLIEEAVGIKYHSTEYKPIVQIDEEKPAEPKQEKQEKVEKKAEKSTQTEQKQEQEQKQTEKVEKPEEKKEIKVEEEKQEKKTEKAKKTTKKSKKKSKKKDIIKDIPEELIEEDADITADGIEKILEGGIDIESDEFKDFGIE
jgi:hypothetical protein